MLPSLIIEKGILIIPNILPANADVLLSPPMKQYIFPKVKGAIKINLGNTHKLFFNLLNSSLNLK